MSKVFDMVWHAGLLHKLKSYGISGEIFDLIFSFLSNRWHQVVLDGISSQEYPFNAGVPQGSIPGPDFFLLYINDLPDDVICTSAVCVDDTTLYSACDQVPVAATRIGFWTWIKSTEHFGLGQEMVCWFECWKNSTGII